MNLKSMPVKLIYHKGCIKKSIERMSKPVDINQLTLFTMCVWKKSGVDILWGEGWNIYMGPMA